MSATMELQDINGKKRMAKCLLDPASAQLGYQEILVCGFNGTAVSLADVSAANTARSTATNVMCVQVLDATGAVMSTTVSLASVTGTDGATAPTKSLLIGGKDGGGLHQDILVDTSGRQACYLQSAGTVGAAAPTIANLTGGKDGAGNLQAMLTGTAGQVLIDFYSNRPGEVTASDWVKMCLEYHLKVGPSATGPTAITTLTTALGPLDCSNYGPFWVYVYSNGAALTTCNVEVSPDGSTGWYALSVKDADEIACGLLASGQVGVAYKFGRGLGGFLRVRLSTATATNATAWLVGQM